MTNRDKVLCSNLVIKNRKTVLSVSYDCGSNKSERNKGLDYITKTKQLNDFSKKVIKKAKSDSLRYQQKTRKVK